LTLIDGSRDFILR
jgi:hypothetical protein